MDLKFKAFVTAILAFSVNAHAAEAASGGQTQDGSVGEVSTIGYAKLGQTGQTPSAEQRISSIGSKFTRDISNPALGEAYRDPSGLVWGSVVKAKGATKHMSEYDAEAYCNAGGARLPTREEFKQLAKYLGDGTDNRYSPYLANGKTEVLPGLSKDWFWSSSVDLYRSYGAYVVDGYDGGVGYGYRYEDYAVRCVSGR